MGGLTSHPRPDLYKQIRAEAEKENLSLNAYIEKVLREKEKEVRKGEKRTSQMRSLENKKDLF